jgi:hypothetical protein
MGEKDNCYWRVELNGQILSAWEFLRIITSLEHEAEHLKGEERAHVEEIKGKLQLAVMGEAPKYMKLGT